jgi:ABC-type glycerol-3-phosphate transport system substrate-binding protein
MVCVTSGTAKKEAAWLFVKHIVFDPHAQQLLGQTGIPVLRSDALDERYIRQQAQLRPTHYRLVVDQGQYGQGFGFNAKWVEWNTAFGNLMNPIMTGKVSAQAGCRQIQQKVEQILAQA